MIFCVIKLFLIYNGIFIIVRSLKYILLIKSYVCVINVINFDNLIYKFVDICYINIKFGDNLFMCCRIVFEILREIF